MPLSADPADLIPFSLPTDESKPEPDRPTFMLRFLTEKEHRKVRRLVEQAGNEPDDDKAAATLAEAIRVGLTELRNVKFRGDVVAVGVDPQEYLTTRELWSLVYAVLNKPQITEDERGKSASSAASDKASTAPSAAGASA
jgi:hypothetical protein